MPENPQTEQHQWCKWYHQGCQIRESAHRDPKSKQQMANRPGPVCFPQKAQFLAKFTNLVFKQIF